MEPGTRVTAADPGWMLRECWGYTSGAVGTVLAWEPEFHAAAVVRWDSLSRWTFRLPPASLVTECGVLIDGPEGSGTARACRRSPGHGGNHDVRGGAER